MPGSSGMTCLGGRDDGTSAVSGGAKEPHWYDWVLTEAADPAATEGQGPVW